MKTFWITILIIAALIGGGLYFSTADLRTTPAPADTEPVVTSTVTASTTDIHIEDKKNRYVADAKLPAISGHVNAKNFNTLVKARIDASLEEFALNAAEANLNTPDAFDGEHHILIARADTSIVNNRYVNVVFTREYSMLGAAHPFHVIETMIYDLDTAETIGLADIFADVSKSLEYISTESAIQIKKSLADNGAGGSFLAEGVKPTEANFKLFTINNAGINLFFSEYQVAPYVAGAQSAKISWQSLRPLLAPEFKVLAD